MHFWAVTFQIVHLKQSELCFSKWWTLLQVKVQASRVNKYLIWTSWCLFVEDEYLPIHPLKLYISIKQMISYCKTHQLMKWKLKMCFSHLMNHKTLDWLLNFSFAKRPYYISFLSSLRCGPWRCVVSVNLAFRHGVTVLCWLTVFVCPRSSRQCSLPHMSWRSRLQTLLGSAVTCSKQSIALMVRMKKDTVFGWQANPIMCLGCSGETHSIGISRSY